MITSERLARFLQACEETQSELEEHFVDISTAAYAEWALTELGNRVFDLCDHQEWAESYLIEDVIDAFAWEMEQNFRRSETETQRVIFSTAVYAARRLENYYEL